MNSDPLFSKREMSNGNFMEQKKEDHCAECQAFHWLLVFITYQGAKFKVCLVCLKRRMY